MGWIPLPAGLHLLQHPLVLGASFIMFVMEFVADKIPGVDVDCAHLRQHRRPRASVE